MINVILLDDHKVILDGVSAILEQSNNIVVEKAFNKPTEMLRYIDSHTVDVLLTDLDMPEMNGEEVVEIAKAKHPGLKIIVLSMHDEKSVIQHLISLGADGYLLKSAGKEEIWNAIKLVSQGNKFFGDDVLMSLASNTKERSMPKDKRLDILTNREIEIIKLIAEGLSSKQIGERLFISNRTAETHRNNFMKKLDIHSVAGIIRFAFETKIVE